MSRTNETNFIKFSEVLVRALQDNDLTQRELAKIMDKDESQISRWINKGNEPIKKTIRLFEDALNVTFYKDANGWGYKNKLHYPRVEEHETEYMTADDKYYRIILEENKMLRKRIEVLHDLLIQERTKNQR